MTIGETLKRARKKMELSLEDVARKTKISKMFLIALEENDIDRLPGGVYTRNFLRTYAKFLNLDEDIITAEYHEQYAVKPHFVTHLEQTKQDDNLFRRQRNHFFLVLFLVIVIGSGFAYLYFYHGETIRGWLGQTTVSSRQSPAVGQGGATLPSPVPEGIERSRESGTTRDGDMGASRLETTSVDVGHGGQGGNEVTDPISTEKTRPPVEAHEVRAGSETDESPGDPVDSPDLVWEGVLPIVDISEVSWPAAERQPASLAAVFALQGLEKVWLEVVIDGVPVTRRFLQKGDVRFYRYGRLQRVTIGNSASVAVQDGPAFRPVLRQRGGYLNIEDFGPGGFLQAVDEQLRAKKSED